MTEINKTSQQTLQRILDKIGVKASDNKNVAQNKTNLGQEYDCTFLGTFIEHCGMECLYV